MESGGKKKQKNLSPRQNGIYFIGKGSRVNRDTHDAEEKTGFNRRDSSHSLQAETKPQQLGGGREDSGDGDQPSPAGSNHDGAGDYYGTAKLSVLAAGLSCPSPGRCRRSTTTNGTSSSIHYARYRQKNCRRAKEVDRVIRFHGGQGLRSCRG